MHNDSARALTSLRYRAVLLDIDGTIVDSNPAHAAAWSEAFAKHDRHISPETVRPLIGKGGDKLLSELAGLDDESGEGRTIAADRAEIFKSRYLPGLQPTRGAREFVEWLLGSGIAVVVATSAKQEELRALLAIAGALPLAGKATTSDDAERSKPDPDIIAAALHKAGTTAAEAVMIGDTPYDIEAAGHAGVATIALRCGGWDDAALSGSIAIYDDPKHLMDGFDQSSLIRQRHQ